MCLSTFPGAAVGSTQTIRYPLRSKSTIVIYNYKVRKFYQKNESCLFMTRLYTDFGCSRGISLFFFFQLLHIHSGGFLQIDPIVHCRCTQNGYNLLIGASGRTQSIFCCTSVCGCQLGTWITQLDDFECQQSLKLAKLDDFRDYPILEHFRSFIFKFQEF